MLEANQSVTVVNLVYDGKTDTEIEVSTVLKNVSVFRNKSASTGTGGITPTDLVKIRIPYALPDGGQLKIGGTVIVNGEEMTILRVHDNTNRRLFPHWYMEAQ